MQSKPIKEETASDFNILRDIENIINSKLEIMQTELNFRNWEIAIKPLNVTF